MGEITKDTYDRLLENRPFKLSADEADYRKAEGPEKCAGCIHLFERRADHFLVCEVVRPDEDGIEAIQPAYTCMFQTEDGQNYPLLKEE